MQNYNHVIDELQDYMLNEQSIIHLFTKYSEKQSSLMNKVNDPSNTIKMNNNYKNNNSNKNNQKDTKIVPNERDTLFWCFYIMVHGIVKYETLQPINLITEKKWKIDYIEKLRLNKTLVKKYKYSTLTHIENQLLNEHVIDIPTFFSLCVLENLNILYIHKKYYYELIMNEDEPIAYVIHRLEQTKKYAYEMVSQYNLVKYHTEYLKIDNLQKPIKAMSSYKLSELIEFCKKINIETVDSNTKKTKNKKELYESLLQYF